jgi:oligoribonuclease NrnB/cAMP/cGMP phosphodiesterase (DHH superfamily)
MPPELSPVYILYHGPHCADGFAARVAAQMHFGDDATYRPCDYKEEGKPLEEIPDEASVYVLDFSFKKEPTRQHIDRFKFFKVLDHHSGVREELKEFSDDPRIYIDESRSGATIAWDFFHPGKEVPEILKVVSDRDRWVFELPYTKAVSAALAIEEKTFENWKRLIEDPDTVERMTTEGNAILKQQNHIVAMAVQYAHPMEIAGHQILASCASSFQSEIGNAICLANPTIPFSACYTTKQKDGKWIMQVALRSIEGGADVSAIARMYGGNGHLRASGFSQEITLRMRNPEDQLS